MGFAGCLGHHLWLWRSSDVALVVIICGFGEALMVIKCGFGRGCQVERVVISFCACDDLFEIRVHGLTHQNADRNFGLGRTDEGLAEQIVEVTQVVADHHGKRLVSGRDCEERVFVQCIAQRGDEVGCRLTDDLQVLKSPWQILHSGHSW